MRTLLKVTIGALLVCVVLEAGFRVYKYFQLKSEVPRSTRYSFSSFKAPIYELDRDTGFAYVANSRNGQWLYDDENRLVSRGSNVIINNFNMMTPADVTLEKPADEFRIAVLGDSFCATTTSDLTWTAALETVLNGDENLKRAFGKPRIRVLNFGLDGTGIIQWPSVYKHKSARFQPDLVIINFIGNDILRAFIYRDTIQFGENARGMVACTSLPVSLMNRDCHNGLSFIIDPTNENYQAKAVEIKNAVNNILIRRLPWLGLYPELLASATNGRLGFKPRLDVRAFPGNPQHKTSDQAIESSLASVREIHSLNPRTLVLYHPTVEEYLSRETPPIVRRFLEKAGDVKMVNMLELAPKDASPEEIKKWYNLPYDAHPRNYGAEIYAQTAAKPVAEFAAAGAMKQ